MTDDRFDDRRFDYIEVSGGKFDGHRIKVELDGDGQPPATWHGSELVPFTTTVLPPHLAHLPGVLESLYTLDQILTADGPKFVYRCDLTVFDDLGVPAMWDPDDPYGLGQQAA